MSGGIGRVDESGGSSVLVFDRAAYRGVFAGLSGSGKHSWFSPVVSARLMSRVVGWACCSVCGACFVVLYMCKGWAATLSDSVTCAPVRPIQASGEAQPSLGRGKG
jgi:hypothetical protein